MTCKAIGSPDRFSSSTEPRYVTVTASKVSKYGVFSGPYFPVFGPEKTPYLDTFHAVVWYCLICTAPYLISRLLSFFSRFFVSNNVYLVLPSPKCAGTLNKSHLHKGTIHNLQPGTCKGPKIEALWHSTVDVSNIVVLIFDIDLKSSIREVRFKPCNGLKRKSNRRHFFQQNIVVYGVKFVF